MKSITSLFEETKNANFSEEEKKHLGKANKHIKDISLIPDFHCPGIDSDQHKRDVAAVKHYFYNKSLNKGFLNVSHNSCKKIYKKFCKENNLKVNWKFIKEVLKDVESITHTLKRKFNRPRPKELLSIEDSNFKNVKEMGSASFPIGHTTTAFFISELLSHFYPNDSANFKTIAELVGQSRIENSVHYPSDVLYGKLLGEMLAQIFIETKSNAHFEKILKSNISKSDQKLFSTYLRGIALKDKNDKQGLEDYTHQLTEFICNSNKREGIKLNYDSCYKDCFKFMSGHPIKFSNEHVNSCLLGLCATYKFKDIDSPYALICVHKKMSQDALSKGKPGVFRDYEGYAEYGNSYSHPKDIFSHIKKLKNAKNPFVKHIIFEWIHPFADGNGRVGRVILAGDLNYNFEKVNNFCNYNYLKNIESFIDKHKDIKSLLG